MARSFNLTTKIGEGECERHHTKEDDEETFHLGGQGTVNGIGCLKVVGLNVLQHHGCLTYTTCSKDAKHTHVPVNKVVQIALEIHINGLRKAG